jgi:signal transduction histidine kinase
MVNLLSNAFKYTDKGKIEYGFEFEDKNVRFYVADSGSGIDVTDHEKVFDHFYKSMKDKMKLYRGTGIGLAICKRLVEQMGGEIRVESTINVGSVFSFILPRKQN